MGLTRYGTSAAEPPSHRLRNAEVPEHITKMREKLDEVSLCDCSTVFKDLS